MIDIGNRIILHSDLNCFFAAVETVLHPEYRGKAIAVCGNTELRHGIVLAKSEKAKRAGVKTGMANWQAKNICPELEIVHPGYENYMKFSRIVRNIYERYSDLVESLGMDECWIDVSRIVNTMEKARLLAEELRGVVKDETGLTVSVGVSFNKIFAKLGSDLKKPDAVSVISPENFRDIVWRLPVGNLMGVGRNTQKVFSNMNIHTIGDLAKSDKKWLAFKLGKCGVMLWNYANGLDLSPVVSKSYEYPVKSVGHGTTTEKDMENSGDVRCVIIDLVQEIGRKLRESSKLASGVAVSIRTDELSCKEWQRAMDVPTSNSLSIANAAFELFSERYRWERPLRSITIRAINLVDLNQPLQLELFRDYKALERAEKLDRTVDNIRKNYGNSVIRNAVLLGNSFTNSEGRNKD